MTVSFITHPLQAEKTLHTSYAHHIAEGREALMNPNWELIAAQVWFVVKSLKTVQYNQDGGKTVMLRVAIDTS